MVTAEQLEGLQRVDFTISWDHGGGKFHMALKILLHFSDKTYYLQSFPNCQCFSQ
jgi:hypothetical protein